MAGLNILHPCFLAACAFYGRFGEMALGVSFLSQPAGFFRMYSVEIRLYNYIQGRQRPVPGLAIAAGPAQNTLVLVGK